MKLVILFCYNCGINEKILNVILNVFLVSARIITLFNIEADRLLTDHVEGEDGKWLANVLYYKYNLHSEWSEEIRLRLKRCKNKDVGLYTILSLCNSLLVLSFQFFHHLNGFKFNRDEQIRLNSTEFSSTKSRKDQNRIGLDSVQ